MEHGRALWIHESERNSEQCSTRPRRPAPLIAQGNLEAEAGIADKDSPDKSSSGKSCRNINGYIYTHTSGGILLSASFRSSRKSSGQAVFFGKAQLGNLGSLGLGTKFVRVLMRVGKCTRVEGEVVNRGGEAWRGCARSGHKFPGKSSAKRQLPAPPSRNGGERAER